jgi:putative hydrolase of HD superfamily
MSPTDGRLERQLQFLLELDKLKQIVRRTYLTDRSRLENDAEHSWHLAVYAMVLIEHAPAGVDRLRVLQMVVVHDVVEIDAGDTFLYDDAANADKAERERRAADRIFALLPADQASAVRRLWEEFEARATPEAKFAAAVDRLQSLMNNLATKGASWREHGVTAGQILARARYIGDSAPALWAHVQSAIQEAVAQGFVRP